MSEIHGHGPGHGFHVPSRRSQPSHADALLRSRQPAPNAGQHFADGKTITFDFFDGTNIPSPEAGHMQRLMIAMPDSDHHTEVWTLQGPQQADEGIFRSPPKRNRAEGIDEAEQLRTRPGR